uniref:Uncharacterized protein n=1 Tax=Cannabis sativa TaxID=3483 RepID=A0A803PTI7_CANSA
MDDGRYSSEAQFLWLVARNKSSYILLHTFPPVLPLRVLVHQWTTMIYNKVRTTGLNRSRVSKITGLVAAETMQAFDVQLSLVNKLNTSQHTLVYCSSFQATGTLT